jgi:hypothetical protein
MSNTETRYLLRQFCFSNEAISFIKKQGNRYLPALATLANHAAKVISPEYYDLKGELCDQIAEVATEMGWRTFETYDSGTSAYPYIFYVDSSIFPQCSFHSAESRPTNFPKGKWSGAPVQDIAPTLIKNRLKKDGFKGSVLDLKLITINILNGQFGGEADHLYKGQTYKLVAESENLEVMLNGFAIEASLPFLQSFISQFSQSKSPKKTGEDCEDNQSNDNSEQNDSIGNDIDELSADSQSGGDDTQEGTEDIREITSAMSEAQVGTSNSANEFGEGEPVMEDTNANNGENETSLAKEDLDISPDELANQAAVGETQKEILSGEQSMNDKVSENLTTQVSEGGESQDTKGFFDFLDSLKPKAKKGSGGGRQIDRRNKSTAKPSILVQEALLKLAGGKSLGQKIDGQDRFCGKKVVKALTTSPHKLMNAKFDRPADKVYFFVDTSGSVATFGNFIISMIKSAENSPNIEVWSGSEAHPETNERTNKRTISYTSDFAENMQTWIDLVQPQIGSTLIFWGDLQCANIVSSKLKKVCQNYRCVWLQCLSKEDGYNFKISETEQIKSAGFKVTCGIKDEKSLARGINSIL